MNRISSAVALVALIATGAVAAPQKKAPVRRATPAAAAKPAAKPAAPAVYYDFKGAKLGMTIEEWKAMPPPLSTSMASYASKGDGPERVWCSNEKMPDGKDVTGFYLSDAETALGVVACKYGKMTGIGDYHYITSSYVKIGEYISDDVSYKFLDGKLYEISISGSKNLLTDMLDGLTAKFGAPTTDINDTTQNKAGATFPHTEKTWLNPVASIHLEAPFTKIDNLNVTYMAMEPIGRIAAKKRELHPAADKM